MTYHLCTNWTKEFYLGASFNFNLHINTEHFGETLEGTGQVEDLRNPHRFICVVFLAEAVP